jgi:predicted transcriptional regulator
MSNFKQFLQYRALDLKFSLENSDLTDAVIESGAEPIPLRNVCAKLTVELAERIDRTAENLGVTKRQFIERALIEAMDQADAAFAEIGVWDEIEERLEQSK